MPHDRRKDPAPDDDLDLDVDEEEEDPVDAAVAGVDPDTVGLDTEDLELGAYERNAEDPQYDADGGEHLDLWLELDESQRLEMVMEAHERSRAPTGADPLLHATIHVVVENQLAMRAPPSVHTTLDRLRRAGVRRHAAIHAIGAAVAETMFASARWLQAPDLAEYERLLAAISPQAWLTPR